MVVCSSRFANKVKGLLSLGAQPADEHCVRVSPSLRLIKRGVRNPQEGM